MAGKKGRSGGWNRIAPEVHLLKGTWRADRHARPPEPTDPEWHPTEALLATLGPAGQALITRFHDAYIMGLVQGELLSAAAIATDRIAGLREARVGAALPVRLKLERAEHAWQKHLVGVLLSMKVEP